MKSILRKVQAIMIKDQKQISGDRAISVQTGSDSAVKIAVNSIEEMKSIAELVFDANFPRLQEAALESARKNMREFVDLLGIALAKNVTPYHAERFQGADIQFLLAQVLPRIAKRSERSKAELVATIVAKRVNEDEDLLSFILEDAARVAAEMPSNLIRSCALLYAIHTGLKVTSLEQLKSFLHWVLDKTEGASLNRAASGVMVTLRCASHVERWGKLEECIFSANSGLLSIKAKDRLGIPSYTDTEREEFRKLLEVSPEQGIMLDLFNKNFMSLSVTPVGKVIAITFFECQGFPESDMKKLLGL